MDTSGMIFTSYKVIDESIYIHNLIAIAFCHKKGPR